MARPASTQPTDRELDILKVLWELGPAGLGRICQELRRHRAVAKTTVATMLTMMLDKGLVRRRGSGRGARWTATMSHQRTARGMVGKLVDRVFDGAADRLAVHLIEGGQLSNKQLAELRTLIDQRSRRSRSRKGANQ